METIKLGVLYAHLIAVCFALVAVLKADYRLWGWRGQVLDSTRRRYLEHTQLMVTRLLVLLWGTGLMMIVLGYAKDGSHYLANPKLWAKLTVVLILTLNGALLHRIVFPLLTVRLSFCELPLQERLIVGTLGALSCSSWLFAAMLGVARDWSYREPYTLQLGLYLLVLLFALSGALILAVMPGSLGRVRARGRAY
ncbi:hypothetical protein [Chitinolyticbacter albus]|uniref:hypothetical protein n=1 Tax=Chitinolyticbacter albus TaxID=2961951 RepID=UPI00210A5499|nr:hypothetical protein [Chitinolyticbacter albus]